MAATDGCSSDSFRWVPADSAILAGALPKEKDGAESRPPKTCFPNVDREPVLAYLARPMPDAV